MPTFDIHEAGTQLSRLLDQAARGENVIISRNGKPVARIASLEPARPRIRFGVLKGKLGSVDTFDFQAPLPEDLLGGFTGEEP